MHYCNKFKKGYTLAEMLVVLAIFSLMMIALPPLTKKMFKVDTMAKAHGRFECYYNKDGNLIQYQTSEKGEPIYSVVTTSESITVNGVTEDRGYCEFVPPSNSIYTMIHAVGGGGAGYNVASSFSSSDIPVTTTDAFSYLYYGVVNLWPDWFRYLMNNDKSSLSFNEDKFETKKTFKSVSLPYGLAGEAGEKISMFYPRLRGVTIRMYPGKGGTVAASGSGANGTATVIGFKYTDTDYETTYLVANGGSGGNTKGKYGAALVGGDPTDYGVSELTAVKMHESGFDTTIEDSGVEDNHDSRINVTSGKIKGKDADWGGNKAGWGGNGSYYFISKELGDSYKGDFSYQVNNYSEIPTGSGDFTRKDNWRIVTSYITKNFYKRYNNTAKCELAAGGVEVVGQCRPNKTNLSIKYDCTIDSIEKVKGSGNTVYDVTVDNGNNVSSNPSGYQNCRLVDFKDYIICTSTSTDIADSHHVCSYASADKGRDSYKCIGAKDSNLCKASSGGNGAVIILW